MVGFGVRERCPKCRMQLDVIAAPPDMTVLHQTKCRSRRCRDEAEMWFVIRGGKALALTREQAEGYAEELRQRTDCLQRRRELA